MPPGHCRAWGSRPGAVPGGILGGGRRGDKGADLHTEYTPVRSRLRPRTVSPTETGASRARLGQGAYRPGIHPCINSSTALRSALCSEQHSPRARMQLTFKGHVCPHSCKCCLLVGTSFTQAFLHGQVYP